MFNNTVVLWSLLYDATSTTGNYVLSHRFPRFIHRETLSISTEMIYYLHEDDLQNPFSFCSDTFMILRKIIKSSLVFLNTKDVDHIHAQPTIRSYYEQ